MPRLGDRAKRTPIYHYNTTIDFVWELKTSRVHQIRSIDLYVQVCRFYRSFVSKLVWVIDGNKQYMTVVSGFIVHSSTSDVCIQLWSDSGSQVHWSTHLYESIELGIQPDCILRYKPKACELVWTKTIMHCKLFKRVLVYCICIKIVLWLDYCTKIIFKVTTEENLLLSINVYGLKGIRQFCLKK